MASGDDIEAGRTTTAYSTTVVIAEVPALGFTDFNGNAILQVLPNRGTLKPLSNLDGIIGAGFLGGTGITGFGGVAGGSGVVGRGAAGSAVVPTPMGGTPPPAIRPGPGVVADGGPAIDGTPTAASRRRHGPGLVATAGGSAQPLTPADTANVGAFGQGGDQVDERLAVEGQGDLPVAELWFCNRINQNGSTNWAQLA